LRWLTKVLLFSYFLGRNILWGFCWCTNILFVFYCLGFCILCFFDFGSFIFCVMRLNRKGGRVILHYETVLTHCILIFLSDTLCTYWYVHLWIFYRTFLQCECTFKYFFLIIYLWSQVYINNSSLLVAFWSTHCETKYWLLL